MVHGAIYDAVNAIDGRHQPYLPQPPASPTASLDAAVAAAAYNVLVGLPATIPPSCSRRRSPATTRRPLPSRGSEGTQAKTGRESGRRGSRDERCS